MRMLGTAPQSTSFGALVNRRDNKVSGKIAYILRTAIVTDKVGYPIREYATNAWEVTTKKPFEIELPSPFNLTFQCRDYGPGLSHRFMMTKFPVLGESTKDEDDDSPGGWGLGSKSGLAYGDTFTVISRHKGTRRSYLISLAETGQIQVECMEEVASIEESGLEVLFPVKPEDVSAFQERARQILWSFDPRPVISPAMDWKAPEIVSAGKGWAFYTQSSVPWSGPHVRIGPVIYPIDLSQLEGPQFVLRTDAILFEAEIGSLSVSASRESLQYDDRTKTGLKLIIDRYTEDYASTIQADVDQAKTYFEAASVFERHTAVLFGSRHDAVRDKISWKGMKIVAHLNNIGIDLKACHLCKGWTAQGERFKQMIVDTSSFKDVQIVIECRPYRSMDRMMEAGLEGKEILWVRVKPEDRDRLIDMIGVDNAIVLDDVKIDPIRTGSRPKQMRIRRVIGVDEIGATYDEKELVDLSAGGLYALRVPQRRRWNGDHFNVGSGYKQISQYDLVRLMQGVSKLCSGPEMKVLVPHADDVLGEDWYYVGEYLELRLRDIYDPASTPMTSRGSGIIPNELLNLVRGNQRSFFSGAPDDLRQFYQELCCFADDLDRSRNGPDPYRPVRELLTQLVNVDQTPKVLGLDQIGIFVSKWDAFKGKYKLLKMILERAGWYNAEPSVESMLSHYFDLIKGQCTCGN